MDRRTVATYERHAREWIGRRRPRALEDGRLAAFRRGVRRRGVVADLGCGPGWYAQALRRNGRTVIAVDVAAAMLAEVSRHAPGVARLRADLAALPLRRQCLDGAWAANCYSHVGRGELAVALAHLQAALRPGVPVELTLAHLEDLQPTQREWARGEAERRWAGDELPGRLFTGVTRARARDLLEGAGFERITVEPVRIGRGFWLRIRARCARSLPDLVRPGLRLLICGLNPSLYSADAGVPFARPGNRFWPAARLAGLVARERDAFAALWAGIGTTDLVKRATTAAAELRSDEYRRGLRRVESLVRRYRPRATCFVGLEGWRMVVDRRAQPGWIAGGLGGRPAYLMPSTSGRNARVPLERLAAHLYAAGRGPHAAADVRQRPVPLPGGARGRRGQKQ